MILPLESDIVAIKLVLEIFERGDDIFSFFFFFKKTVEFLLDKSVLSDKFEEILQFPNLDFKHAQMTISYNIYISFFNQFLSLKNISTILRVIFFTGSR